MVDFIPGAVHRTSGSGGADTVAIQLSFNADTFSVYKLLIQGTDGLAESIGESESRLAGTAIRETIIVESRRTVSTNSSDSDVS